MASSVTFQAILCLLSNVACWIFCILMYFSSNGFRKNSYILRAHMPSIEVIEEIGLIKLHGWTRTFASCLSSVSLPVPSSISPLMGLVRQLTRTLCEVLNTQLISPTYGVCKTTNPHPLRGPRYTTDRRCAVVFCQKCLIKCHITPQLAKFAGPVMALKTLLAQ